MSIITNVYKPDKDHHNGYYFIDENQKLKISQYKQMSVFGILENEGQLQIEGMLILEE